MCLASMHFTLFYCLSLSVFSSSVSSWGAARLGVVSGLLLGVLSHGWFQPGWLEGSAPWCLPGLGVVSVAVFPAALDYDLSQCGWSPKVASSSPQALVLGHVSLVTASVYVDVSAWVYVCMCVTVGVCIWVCMCISLCISVRVGGLGSSDFLFLIFFVFFKCLLLFLIPMRHFMILSVWKLPYK